MCQEVEGEEEKKEEEEEEEEKEEEEKCKQKMPEKDLRKCK